MTQDPEKFAQLLRIDFPGQPGKGPETITVPLDKLNAMLEPIVAEMELARAQNAGYSSVEAYNVAQEHLRHLEDFRNKLVHAIPIVGKAAIQEDDDTVTSTAELKPSLVPPPALGEILLGVFVPKRSRDTIIGDFNERFHLNRERYGDKRAKRFYWIDVLREIKPMVARLLRKVGLFALLADKFLTK